MEWGELATHLGLSRSMLDFIRKGQRNLSFKALRRLEEAERAAGILPPVVEVTRTDESSVAGSKEKLKIVGKGVWKGDSDRERLLAAISQIEAGLAEMKKLLGK